MTHTQDAAAVVQTETLPAIELVGLVKSFTSHGEVVQAVKGIDMKIAEGEFFSMLGPSGCGKTTTMRMIAGFDEPTAGEVYLHGGNVVGVPPNKRDVNMVFQSYALFPHMSVAENVAFGLKRRGVVKEEVTRRVGEMLEIVGLTGREKRRPKELSGGQQQRVALARALVNNPRALLLDEPLAALDLKLRQAMQVELKRIQREVGITFVFVTHDQGEALGAEAVISYGPDERLIIQVSTGQVRVGSEIELTVRPEKIVISIESPHGNGSAVKGTVTEVVYLGTATNYNVKTSTGADVVVFTQNATSAGDIAVRGDSIWLSWEPRHSYVIGA